MTYVEPPEPLNPWVEQPAISVAVSLDLFAAIFVKTRLQMICPQITPLSLSGDTRVSSLLLTVAFYREGNGGTPRGKRLNYRRLRPKPGPL